MTALDAPPSEGEEREESLAPFGNIDAAAVLCHIRPTKQVNHGMP
jgi:hypothetical protein